MNIYFHHSSNYMNLCDLYTALDYINQSQENQHIGDRTKWSSCIFFGENWFVLFKFSLVVFVFILFRMVQFTIVSIGSVYG